MKYTFALLFSLFFVAVQANPISGLLERIDRGASRKFSIEIVSQGSKLQAPDSKAENAPDFFELSQAGDKVRVRANTWVNAAVGINWYLKYYCGIHLSWNQMQAKLPAVLPKVEQARAP